MRLLKTIFLLCLLHYASGKTNTKALTESMGQEVIEIGAPIKELSQDLEEEPSAEKYDVKVTSTTVQAATKKEFAKTPSDPNKKVKDIDKIDGRRQEDDEMKIEKELADIYKDSLDYKADSAEVTKEVNVSTSTAAEDSSSLAPLLRARHEFKFQPDSDHPREVMKFRTSIDEISCGEKLSATKAPDDVPINAAGGKFVGNILLWTTVLYKL